MKKNTIISSLILGFLWITGPGLALADTTTDPSNTNNTSPANLDPNAPAQTAYSNMMTVMSQSQQHLANIDQWLTFQNANLATMFPTMGMSYFQNAFSTTDGSQNLDLFVSTLPSASPNNSPGTSGSQAMTPPLGLTNLWLNFCADQNNVIYQSFGNPINQQTNTWSSVACENAVTQSNANNIIPLVMPASSLQWQAVLPSSPTAANSLSGVSPTPLPLASQIQALTAIPSNPSAQPNSQSNPQSGAQAPSQSTGVTPSMVQNYIDQLMTVPSTASGTPGALILPELSLISGVLQAVSNDYQSGRMNNLDQSVSQEFSSAWNTQVANANTPQLLRMMVIEMAKNNQIQAQQLKQNQRDNVLLAVILADLVKLNESNNAVISSVNESTQQETYSRLLLGQLLQEGKHNSGGRSS